MNKDLKPKRQDVRTCSRSHHPRRKRYPRGDCPCPEEYPLAPLLN